MSEGKTEASIYQQAEDGKTELSLMHFAITNPHWQPPLETTHFISQLKERVHREATGAETHSPSLSESEVGWCTRIRAQLSQCSYLTPSELKIDFTLLSALFLVAKKSRRKPHGRPLHTGFCTFWPRQLFDQSCSSWSRRWSVCLALSFPNQQQSSSERQFECCSSSQWCDQQSNDRFWVS